MFSNPIVMCGAIALGIVVLLVLVVIICCVRSSKIERDELKALSMEIDSGVNEVEESDDKIESVLSKMQEALDMKEENPVSFEQEQEDNAIISYQELLASLGAKSSIDVDSIEVYDDELDSRIEISDFNKEIIDSYQSESLDREIYRFQNDFSSEEMPIDFPSVEVTNVPCQTYEKIESVVEEDDAVEPVYEARHVVGNHKFKSSEFISPVYGIMDNKVSKSEEVEKIDFDDDSL